MRDIAVVMSVAGNGAYFEFASYSIPSFLRNNKSTDLFVFTDDMSRVERIAGADTGRLCIIDILGFFKKYEELVRNLEASGVTDEQMSDRTKRYGFLHHHIFVSALLPFAEYHLQEDERYSHILKIDCDSYFAGGDMMELVREDVLSSEDCELFLVERRHPLMEFYSGGKPGVGFTLWRKGSRFIPQYIGQFNGTEQVTILNLYRKKAVKTRILTRPGHHFVRPFWKNKDVTKEMLEEFLPTYFHLHGIHGRENVKKLEEWFNV